MNGSSPQNVQCQPPLRQAATTLYVSAESVVDKVSRPEKVVQPDNVVRKDNQPEKKVQFDSAVDKD